jgi:antitoxin (DNA-binding transcriptional repressor) of toxin-antitoxin stability system
MRQVQLRDDQGQLQEILASVAEGHRLILLRGGEAVAEVAPADSCTEEQLWSSEQERQRAGTELMEMLRAGNDLGGLRLESRDDLYDRDADRNV